MVFHANCPRICAERNRGKECGSITNRCDPRVEIDSNDAYGKMQLSHAGLGKPTVRHSEFGTLALLTHQRKHLKSKAAMLPSRSLKGPGLGRTSAGCSSQRPVDDVLGGHLAYTLEIMSVLVRCVLDPEGSEARKGAECRQVHIKVATKRDPGPGRRAVCTRTMGTLLG